MHKYRQTLLQMCGLMWTALARICSVSAASNLAVGPIGAWYSCALAAARMNVGSSTRCCRITFLRCCKCADMTS